MLLPFDIINFMYVEACFKCNFIFLFPKALLVIFAIVLVSAAPAHDETIVDDVANDEGKTFHKIGYFYLYI